MGYSSLYERDLFFNFVNGVLLGIREVDNSEKYKQILEEKEFCLKKQEMRQEKQKKGFAYSLKKLFNAKNRFNLFKNADTLRTRREKEKC